MMFTALGLFHWITDVAALAESRAIVENLRITLSDPNIGIETTGLLKNKVRALENALDRPNRTFVICLYFLGALTFLQGFWRSDIGLRLRRVFVRFWTYRP
ncbi:MAG: hypothetical protein ABJM65_09955 [Ascidiaceihabitans sp.]|uniref:hypothetical protein n=1 Tax=Ascidiaceihabitans sp. TaxID=1872644 RepID=UPI0032972FAA